MHFTVLMEGSVLRGTSMARVHLTNNNIGHETQPLTSK